MGIIKSSNLASVSTLKCNESFDVTLSLTAVPDIVTNPADIVLVLDRSGSMNGLPLEGLKAGAKKFIDIIDRATDDKGDGQIGNGSRIGIVSFSSLATVDVPLSTSVAELNSKVDALVASGSTSQEQGFIEANKLFDSQSPNQKIIVMFTDGKGNSGTDPKAAADAAKASGAVIYCLGLEGAGGIDIPALESWSTTPSSAYVSIAPTPDDLVNLFGELAANITKPGATDIVVTDFINNCFQIEKLSQPTKGGAVIESNNQIKWSIDSLGATHSEGAVLTFTLKHLGKCQGLLNVDNKITYKDNESNDVRLTTPQVTVNCNSSVCPEKEPTPIDVTVDSCSDVGVATGEATLNSVGRMIEVNAVLKSICPGKRVALGIVLTEVAPDLTEENRGFKAVLVPAHRESSCKDIEVNCIRFVVPEELNPTGDTQSLCNPRSFKVKLYINYVDTDIVPCCVS